MAVGLIGVAGAEKQQGVGVFLFHEELLSEIKKADPETAVIVTSAKDDVQTRVELLRAGADDYMVKPFDTEEFLARLEAALRRCAKDGRQAEQGRTLCFKDIVMDTDEHRVTVSGQEIFLTKREYFILELLISNPNKVFTKNNIYESVWNEEFVRSEERRVGKECHSVC